MIINILCFIAGFVVCLGLSAKKYAKLQSEYTKIKDKIEDKIKDKIEDIKNDK